MSYTAISEVTKAIVTLLKKKMKRSSSLPITLLPPGHEKLDNEEGLNLYLYRVVENLFFKNRNWQGDHNKPGLSYPPLALNLFYLLTPYAKDLGPSDSGTDEAITHQILGDAMEVLHENPVLNDVHDNDFDANKNLDEDLRNSFEKIKISLSPISMEELSKIWSTINKPYRLSVIYEVSLVQIAPAIRPIMTAPVMEVNVDIRAPSPPFISGISPQYGPAGTEITLTGGNFLIKGLKTTVDANGKEAIKKIHTDKRIIFDLPSVFTHGPDVDIRVTVGNESSSAKFIVSPWIDKISPIRGPVNSNDPESVKLIIKGVGFKNNAKIKIDEVTVKPVSQIGETEIIINVPGSLSNGEKSVTVFSDGSSSNSVSFEVVPLLKSLSPENGKQGQTVTVAGERLGGKAALYIGNTTLGLGTNNATTELTFKVPSLPPGVYSVKIVIDGHVSNSLSFEVSA